jgi:AcrR family transcriptional regulator
MTRPGPDRTALLDALAAHVLAHGLNSASLRPLAAAAGTSDRMLIYHFGSKDGLIAALLRQLADRMQAGLSTALPPGPFATEGALLRAVVGLMRSPPFRPYIRVWFDIVSAAAQGQVAHHAAGQEILSLYADWIAVRHPEGPAAAPRLLALVEGILLMDAVGQAALADAAIAAAGD